MANKTSRGTTQNKKIAKVNAKRKNTLFGDKRNGGLIALIAVLTVVGVGLIGVAAAAFTQPLNINGTATVKGQNWDVHFSPTVGSAALTGEATETTAPTVTGNNTKIGDYAVVLKQPGDAVAYTVSVVNDGDINAEITSVTIKTGSGLTCTSTSDKADTVCANLSYTLKNSDNSTVAVGDVLDAGDTKTMTLKLELSSSLTETDMPDADVAVSGLDVVITYGQKAE